MLLLAKGVGMGAGGGDPPAPQSTPTLPTTGAGQ
jgi:hypothetical protein